MPHQPFCKTREKGQNALTKARSLHSRGPGYTTPPPMSPSRQACDRNTYTPGINALGKHSLLNYSKVLPNTL